MTVDSPVEYPANERAARLAQSEEWRKLLRHFDLNEGFAFALLLVPDSFAAGICEGELRRILGRSGKGLLPVRFPNAQALRDLPSKLLDLQPAQSDAAVWVATAVPAGTPQYKDWRDAWRQTAARLNENRNPLRRRLNLTLLFVGAPWLQEVLREVAPDLWSVRTLVVEIASRLFTPAVVVAGSGDITFEVAGVKGTGTVENLDPALALEQANRLRGKPDQRNALARLLVRAADAFAGARQFGEAIHSLREAVEIYRELAIEEPGRYLPELARSLLFLGYSLKETWRWEDALSAAEEATRLCRQLSSGNPDAFLPDLAGSLNNLGNYLSNLGRHDEALATAKEAVGLYRRIARERPDAFLSGLAASLSNLGEFFSALGQFEEALTAAEEAASLYRQLARERPDAFAPYLARSLVSLHSCLIGLGREEEALAVFEEATGLQQRLAKGPDTTLLDRLVEVTKELKQAESKET
jgi:tetratricopeptide (TPR) repeat protein